MIIFLKNKHTLEVDGFKKFVRDVNRVKVMSAPKPKAELGSEPVFTKLGKSLVAARDILKGEILFFSVSLSYLFCPFSLIFIISLSRRKYHVRCFRMVLVT